MAPPALARGDLASLDTLDVDALVLPLFEARAQPLGVAGNVDWRLCGRLARMLASGRFTGARGEAVLMTSLERVGATRLLLVGLGPPSATMPPLDAVVRILLDAQALSVAVAVPQSPTGAPSAAAIREAWRDSPAWGALGEVAVVLLDDTLPRTSVPPTV